MSRTSSKFGQIGLWTAELAALEHLEKSPKTKWENLVTTLAPFLIESSSFLQVTRTCMKSRTISKFGQNKLRAAELAAHEHLEKKPIDLYWEKCCDHSSSFIFD